MIWKNKRYFGKYGFTSKSKKSIKPINLRYFEEKGKRL